MTELPREAVTAPEEKALRAATDPRPARRNPTKGIGLLGAAQASAYKQHLAIDLLAMKLQGGAKRALNVVIECCIIVFAALVMVKGGLALTMDTLAKHQQTSVLQWPMGYVYMVVPVAGALMVLFAVVAIIRELSNRTGGAA